MMLLRLFTSVVVVMGANAYYTRPYPMAFDDNGRYASQGGGARGPEGGGGRGGGDPVSYSFRYSVLGPQAELNFGHEESRDGPTAQGSYYVTLPDGRLQRVVYRVGGPHGGYHAQVSTLFHGTHVL